MFSRSICCVLLLLLGGPSIVGPAWHQHGHVLSSHLHCGAHQPQTTASSAADCGCASPTSMANATESLVSPQALALLAADGTLVCFQEATVHCGRPLATPHDCSVCRFYKYFQVVDADDRISFEVPICGDSETVDGSQIEALRACLHARGPPMLMSAMAFS